MEWIKSSIETTSAGVELVTSVLMQCNIAGVEIIDSQERARYFADSARTWDYADESLMVADSESAYVVFYVTANAAGEKQLAEVGAALLRLANYAMGISVGALTMRQEHANDETWLNEWKKHFKPLRIGRVVVVPEWETFVPENDEDIIFMIDPGTAFGTGQHQTTQLCVHAVQKWVQAGDVVLDVGCGSGILAIISMLLGASEVYAIDVDPAGAIAATKKNTSLNPVDSARLTIRSGDVLTDESARTDVGYAKYDVVVANIVADVIIPLAPLAAKFAKPGGLFVSSGIISERLDEVLLAFAASNIIVLEVKEMEGWHSVVGRLHA